ncbi:hypothetical protein BV898_07528 [Hypsibius exemplaris]|uniref:Uncharacterized protein n=1 Tax=Hypsibius exemplaris TaxID=2072580 RepID=A0A1W0WT03_HYPEX|nr:hypothetical protein BV898_07528 [Hypsibius exemplaris]
MTLTADPYFADLIDEIRRDPTNLFSYSQKECLGLLAWLINPTNPVSPINSAYPDYTVLHCLLRTPGVSIDSVLQTSNEPGRETAFSLAVLDNNVALGQYLLKMNASPDILVGWSAFSQRACCLALDRVGNSTEIEAVWRDLILRFCKVPCRISDEDRQAPEYPISDFGFLEWVKESEISQFDQGIEYDVSVIKLQPESVAQWSRIRTSFVFAKLMKRRPGGAIACDFPVIDFLLETGQVGVDNYLVDDVDERITALHEAVSRKNVPLVRHLLKVHQANPNKMSYADAMPWHDQTHIVTPLQIALRGFLVWDEEETVAFRQIVNLLLDAGISEEVQIEAIDTIWTDRIMEVMELQEALHFVKMVELILARTPSIARKLRRSLSYAIPMLLKYCETRWIKDTFEGFANGKTATFATILKDGIELLVATSKLDPTPVTPEILCLIISARAYRTLAAMVVALGRLLPLELVKFEEIIISNILTDEMVEAGVTLAQAEQVHARRVRALLDICVRATSVAQRWRLLLLRLCNADLPDGMEQTDVSAFSFTDCCIAAVNDAKREGFLTAEIVQSIMPGSLFREVSLEKQFTLLEKLSV